MLSQKLHLAVLAPLYEFHDFAHQLLAHQLILVSLVPVKRLPLIVQAQDRLQLRLKHLALHQHIQHLEHLLNVHIGKVVI